ncbi:hypothetical protein, partial [Bacillus sp. JJ722]|uniref:hypothetical protein n=1 Tax=Bacillus sp. JJ722 TaxID=3122973 RepID=UPI002FFF5639
ESGVTPMENKELLLAITELKSSIDKRFDNLEKQFDKRLDSVSEELYKIKKNLDTDGQGQQFEDHREKLSKLERDIIVLNHDVKYLSEKYSTMELRLLRIERQLNKHV